MFHTVLLILCILILPGCRPRDETHSGGDIPEQLLPDTLPGQLWQYLQQQTYRSNWFVLRSTGRRYEARRHGPLATTYFSFLAYDAVSNGATSLSDNAVIVHEQLQPDSSIERVLAMLKVAGYDSADSDWYFAEYLPDGTVVKAGRVVVCAECHSHARADYIQSIALGTSAATSGAQ